MEFLWYNPLHYTQETVKKYIPYIVKQESLYDTYEEPIYKSNPIIIKNKSQLKQLIIPISNNRQNPNNPMTICINLKNQIFLETEYLERYYENVSVSISPTNILTIIALIPKKKQIRLLSEPIIQDKLFLPNKITFIIQQEYPNIPPELYLNDIKYKTVIECCNLERVRHIIKNHFKIFRDNCISCKSILKKENWKNKMMFSNIFTEIQIFQRLKQIVKYDILLNELMEQKILEYPIILNILHYLITI